MGILGLIALLFLCALAAAGEAIAESDICSEKEVRCVRRDSGPWWFGDSSSAED